MNFYRTFGIKGCVFNFQYHFPEKHLSHDSINNKIEKKIQISEKEREKFIQIQILGKRKSDFFQKH